MHHLKASKAARPANYSHAPRLRLASGVHLTQRRIFCTRMAATHATAPTVDTSLAVVGDVHNMWDSRDVAAIQALAPSMAVFVGDFGNEDVSIVQQVADTPVPKVVMLGNHDAWYTYKQLSRGGYGKNREGSPDQPALLNRASRDQLASVLPDGCDNAVLQQLDVLGDTCSAYSAHQVPNAPISIVGARPFSMGGKDFRSVAPLITTLYPDIRSWKDSASQVVQVAATAAAAGNTVILLNHNAPQGLGEEFCDIAGVDWKAGGGDHGDPDLRLALDQLNQQGIRVPLVLCGHMHHKLKGGAKRRMVAVEPDTGTVILNAATVPRVRAAAEGPGSLHHFLCVDLQSDGQLVRARDVWVHVTLAGAGSSSHSWRAHVAGEQEVLRRVQGESGVTFEYWDAYEQEWRSTFVLQAAQQLSANV